MTTCTQMFSVLTPLVPHLISTPIALHHQNLMMPAPISIWCMHPTCTLMHQVPAVCDASNLRQSGFEVRVPLGSVHGKAGCLIRLLQSHWADSGGNGLRAHSGALWVGCNITGNWEKKNVKGMQLEWKETKENWVRTGGNTEGHCPPTGNWL